MTWTFCIIFTVLAVLCLAAVIFTRQSALRVNALWGLTLCAVLAVVTYHFAAKENQALEELSQLIEPLPQISDVTWIMSGPEMEAALETVAPSRADGGLADMTTRFYTVTTDMPGDQAAAFYLNPAHCRDWALDQDASRVNATRSLSILVLRRGGEQLLITIQEDWTETEVWYVYSPTP